MSLEMKTACKTCANTLHPEGEAYICSLECTYCHSCAEGTHHFTCPDCRGDLMRRPTRTPHAYALVGLTPPVVTQE